MRSSLNSKYSLVFPKAVARTAPLATDVASDLSIPLPFASQAVLLFMWSSVLAGPMRYVSILSGLPVYLLPKVLLLVPIALRFLRLRADLRQWLIAAALCILVLVALNHQIRPVQAVFGLWTLLPLVFAMLFPEAVFRAVSHRRTCLYIFAVSLLGEFASYLVVFPWSGLDAQVGGVTTRAAREWMTSNGVRRLAGFGDSSIDLSLTLVIFAGILASKQTRLALRAGLLVVASVAIYCTTMKTALAAFALVAVPMLLPLRPIRIASAAAGSIAVVLGIALPFTLFSGSELMDQLVEHLKGMETLRERLELTWPGVLEYLHQNGIGLLGIGAGGLGSAANLGLYPVLYPSADNFYLYLIGVAGLLGGLLLLLFVKRMISEGFDPDPGPNWYLPLLVFFAIYSCTQPLGDISIPALFFGAMVLQSNALRRSMRTTPP